MCGDVPREHVLARHANFRAAPPSVFRRTSCSRSPEAPVSASLDSSSSPRQRLHPAALAGCATLSALLTSGFQLLLHRVLSVDPSALTLQLQYAALDLVLLAPALFL